MSRHNQYKRLIRFISGIVLIGVQSLVFMYFWIYFYNEHMEMPYQRLGHYFLAAVYALILYIYSSVYGSLRLGYLRRPDLIFTHTLVTICTNATSYIPIVLLVKHFRSPGPLVLLTFLQFLIIVIWGYAANGIYRRLYPPRKVIMVYGERPMQELMEKISGRDDCFTIAESVRYTPERAEEIEESFGDYEGVVICDMPSDIRNDLLKYCYARSVRVYMMPKLTDIIIRGAESMHYFDTPLLLARNEGLSIEQEFIKRVMDIAVSLSMLVITSPIFLIVALCIKACDGGPVFYTQERCTKDGRLFNILKFRSMVVGADSETGFRPTTDHDPRVTSVGEFIRKHRIDELPQLVNILKGEMSLVGPRPEAIELTRLYSERIPEFGYRLKVKAGLTGWAQIYGKYNTSAYDKLKLDLMYIQNYSFLLDIEILFKTVRILFTRESTEGFDPMSSDETEKLTEEISLHEGTRDD